MQKFWKEVTSWQEVENRLRGPSFWKFTQEFNQFRRTTATRSRGASLGQRLFRKHDRHPPNKNHKKARPQQQFISVRSKPEQIKSKEAITKQKTKSRPLFKPLKKPNYVPNQWQKHKSVEKNVSQVGKWKTSKIKGEQAIGVPFRQWKSESWTRNKE